MNEAELQIMIDRAVSRALEQQTPTLVERVADHVEQRLFANVGRHVVTRVLQWVGAVAVGAAVYLYGSGILK